MHALCRSLAGVGHDVHVLTTSVDGPHNSEVPYDRPVDLDSVQIHYCRSNVMRRLYWSPDLYTQCSEMISGFDAVHLHSVFLFPTWAGARVSGRAGVPYVLSPRGMLVGDLIRRRSAATKDAWIRLVERRNLSRAARIHLTSEEERRALDDLGLALAPTVVIPNGVDPPIAFSPDAVSADVRRLVAEGFDILSFGRINWKKGLDRLIRSAAEVQRVKLLIAGHDEDGLAENLRKLAEQYGIGDRVLFLPRQITGPDKEALFAAGAPVRAAVALGELRQCRCRSDDTRFARGGDGASRGCGTGRGERRGRGSAWRPEGLRSHSCRPPGVPRAACRYGCSRRCICTGTAKLEQHRAPLRRPVHRLAPPELRVA